MVQQCAGSALHYWIIAKIKVAVSVDKQRTLNRIYMEKYISV